MNDLLKRLDGLIGPHAGAIKNLMAPLFIVMVLAMMVLPLPAFALDVLFTFNIAMALMVMMVSASMVRPLDFGTRSGTCDSELPEFTPPPAAPPPSPPCCW